ncbi:radical SAM/SPASM protein FxsBH, inactivated beta-hydroxylase extension form [Streptomyces beijiangensis]|uniref:FxsB family radical SAM/SPASM domain protein n=1 Tax=Streptomyces beijiangensis TaxID=163361 RepID=A0A939FD93_9ACTN|nr:radical SAM/SPASM protein FxsB, inactivated metallohydrolase extension form [Streptomyces beijiangensis]MBO0514905.1 FxsB family radical SAM/SPASM domain protein [Streptomyces beijiangensis]
MTGPLVPFREIVLKVHSRCDLACDHCYIYESADQSWRTRPKTISDEAIHQTALRLAEHAGTHALPSVSVILHGGEPLLAGPARLRRVCEELTEAVGPVAELDLRIHTNGLQLSPRYLDLFDEFNVRVGISLDGDQAANDRHRRFADGRTSHPLVLRAVDLLRQDRYAHLNLGLLCTIDVENDPLAVYDALLDLDPPRIDFLLPHATWDEPPHRPSGSPTAYADWILAVYDRWQDQGRPVPVRLFESVLSTLNGGPSLTESLGLAPTDLVVVETDGTLEQVDSLKTAYEGAAATGFDVFHHAFDEVAAHPGVRARQLGLAGVSETCRACPVVRSCGGGLYTHRYRDGSFDHESVYCTDLEALVRGIETRTPAALPASDNGELADAQQELTRTLLARLQADLAGRGGERWDEAWALALLVDERSDEGLDGVLGHPYARSWLLGCLDALREGRPPELDTLGSCVAAAAVRGGLEMAVPVTYTDGMLHLPTLGTLRIAGPGTSGRAELLVAGKEFSVAGTGTDWQPLRRIGCDGAPDLALDDLDPYRDSFGAPPHARLGTAEAEEWSRRFAGVWGRLRQELPAVAEEAEAWLTTVTPLAAGEPAAGRHGPGALGIAADVLTVEGLARGVRRARLRALVEVTDLYAQDGAWLYTAGWAAGPVTVSELLAGVHERAVLGAYSVEIRQALQLLDRAPELTVSGKSLVADLWKEWGAASRLTEKRP